LAPGSKAPGFRFVVRTIKLTIAYDGTDYVGWQRQSAGLSIQGLLEDALRRLENQQVDVIGAGRTDAGVHALAQVASLRLAHPIACDALVRALNAALPADIRVTHAVEADAEFHARYAARWKTYQYRLDMRPVPDLFERRYAWHVPHRLDVEAMREAAAPLIGQHDFAAFQAAGSSAASRGPNIYEIDLRPSADNGEPSLMTLEITASGFLRHMVRIIVGTLVEVGQQRRRADAVGTALAWRDRAAAGPTAPPHGLFLIRVGYEDWASRKAEAES
jgi:tRNA pseudouridine38-40 synthase